MSERRPSSPEKHLETASERSQERQSLKPEHESSKPEKAEQERQERLVEARKTAELESKQTEKQESGGQSEPVRITKNDKRRAYQMTMSRVRSQLPPTSRSFSRVIHNKPVEKASEILEKTVARPSGLLGGSLAAAIGLAIMLFFARSYGFALAGSELVILLAIGWVAGLMVEFIYRLLRRRHHRLH